MPPSLDDSSFIVVGDVFDTDEDEDDIDELSSVASEHENAAGTLILPSAASPTRVAFTPPSSVDSEIPSVDLSHQQRLLVPDEDDDMEGIADPLDLPAVGGPPPNVDDQGAIGGADVRPSKFSFQELSPTTANTTPWTDGIHQARILLQDRMPTMTSSRRRSLLFFYLPVVVAVLGVATYTKHLNTLHLRDLELASIRREQEHQERIQQLQEEIDKLKKQQSGFTFTIPEPTWLKTGMVVSSESTTAQTLLKQWKDIKASAYKTADSVRMRLKTGMVVSSESTTAQTLLKRWEDIKTSAYATVDSVRTTIEKDIEEAKGWWVEKQRLVIAQLETLEHECAQVKEEFSCSDDEDDNNNNNNPEEDETGTDTAETKKKGKLLMPSKKTILVTAGMVTVTSVLLGAAIDAMFGQSTPTRLDYDTFDPTFGVPLAHFVE